MAIKKTAIPTDPIEFGKRAKKTKHKPPKVGAGHSHGHSSIRQVEYKGFEIEIETTYAFKVNGKSLNTHAHVLENGQIHSGALPNYGWTNAIDFVRQLIDSFPDDFVAFEKGKKKKSKSTKNSSPKKKLAIKKKRAIKKKSSGKTAKKKSNRNASVISSKKQTSGKIAKKKR